MVFRQGQPSRGIVFVKAGRLALIRHTESGVNVTLHMAKAGETVAEASLFSPTYHCDCVAMEQSQIVRLSKTTVLDQIENDAEFSVLLMGRFANQIIGYRRRLELLAIPKAEDRVLEALADGWLTGTVMEFAASIGLAHETSYRALSRLMKRGLVNRDGRGKYSLRARTDA